MKAITYSQYGTPEVLHLNEVDKPFPASNEVLVKIRAASVNSWDWDLVIGKPYIYRLLFGVLKPKYRIIGSDIAGVVEMVGSQVKQFTVGDEVFGDISGGGFGAFAEYACVKENALILKAGSMSFEEAAAIPQAGVLALQGLRYGRQVRPGDKVLINGAGGGVGTFAVQLAKMWGAEVTAVDSRSKLDLLQSLGADHVIDYRIKDFTQSRQHYSRILDMVAGKSPSAYQKALTPGGVYAMIGGSVTTILRVALFGGLAAAKGQKLGIVMHEPNKDLNFMKELVESGKVKPVIDSTWPLSKTGEAVRKIGEGRVKGKTVIKCNDLNE